MNSFISRIITRHSYPQNNIIPRLTGKFESTPVVTQSLSENDFGDSDIGAKDNPGEITDNSYIDPTRHKAYESITAASENNTQVLSGKNKASTVKLSNADFETSFIAKLTAEKNKRKGSIMPNENTTAYETKILKPSVADNEHENDAALNYTSSHNLNPDINKEADNFAISTGSLQFIAPAISREDNRKESTAFQIQQPLYTTPLLLPNIVAPLNTGGANQQPIIKVHIGKIEIKAINQPSSNEVRSKSTNAHKPAMTLDDYLKKRNAR